MKALDSLKEDIDDYTEVLASQIDSVYSQIKEIYENYYRMDVDKLNLKIQLIHDDIKIISNETRVLRKMESYYELFKQEQDNATDDFNFYKWKKETLENDEYLNDDGGLHRMKHKVTCNEDKHLTLCIVKDGEVQKEVKVNTDEFIQIMHEQAEEQNK